MRVTGILTLYTRVRQTECDVWASTTTSTNTSYRTSTITSTATDASWVAHPGNLENSFSSLPAVENQKVLGTEKKLGFPVLSTFWFSSTENFNRAVFKIISFWGVPPTMHIVVLGLLAQV